MKTQQYYILAEIVLTWTLNAFISVCCFTPDVDVRSLQLCSPYQHSTFNHFCSNKRIRCDIFSYQFFCKFFLEGVLFDDYWRLFLYTGKNLTNFLGNMKSVLQRIHSLFKISSNILYLYFNLKESATFESFFN